MKTNTSKSTLTNSYNFEKLCEAYSPLKEWVFVNKYGTETIDFAIPEAVKKLNRAILFSEYSIRFWDFPDANLCPPIPSRRAYIDIVSELIKGISPNKKVKILDIGTGASCIYPLIGSAVNSWQFVASDIDKNSLKSAQKIVDENELTKQIELRFQPNNEHIFKDVINEDDTFMVTMSNPPFYKSQEEANEASLQKIKGISNKDTLVRNFSGSQQELCYKGGEKAFLHNYLYESSLNKDKSEWFTILVSKFALVKSMHTSLEKLGATKIKTIPLELGNKISRVVAWKF